MAFSGPLRGIRIVDLSTVVMGPYASQILGDLGADVIKVEPPGGDSTRQTGPAVEPGMAALFLGMNRNKRSVVIDLKTDDGRAALEALIATADVFMHSMRPQKLGPINLQPDDVLARYPRLIFAGLHGFGEDGPYGGRPAYDDIIQGMSGLSALSAMQGGEQRYLPTIAADKTSGLFVAQAILAALVQRSLTERGCYVEIPMFEAMTAFNLVEHMYGAHFDPPLAEMGYPRVLAPWRKPYETADGHVCLMPYTDAHWRSFFEEVGSPGLHDDPRFTSIAQRTRHIADLYELAGGFIAKRSTEQWLTTCRCLDIPAAAVADLPTLRTDEHLAATGFFAEVDDEAMGRLVFPGVPLLFDRQRPEISVPPRLGEHIREVFLETALDEAVIDRLVAVADVPKTERNAA